MIQDQQSSILQKNEEAKIEFVSSKAKFEDAVQIERSYAHILGRMQKDFLINRDKLQKLERKIQKKTLEKQQVTEYSFQTN